MATVPGDDPSFDVREQLARIDKMQAELHKIFADTIKVQQDTRFAPFTLLATGAGAAGALIAAGAALAKLLMS